MRRAVRVGAGAIVAAIAFGACGSNGDGVSTAARDRLTPIISKLRARAAAHDAAGAELALAKLRQNVSRFKQDGDIGDDDAAAILKAATTVEARLTLITTTTTTTTAPPPPPEPPDHDDEHGPPKHGHHKDDKHKDD